MLEAQVASSPGIASSPAKDNSLAGIRRLINSGHVEDALQQLDQLATAQPELAGLDRTRGSALYALNRLVDADAAFAKALKQDIHDLEAAQMRGLTLFRLGRPADAIPLLESAPGTDLQTKADPSYVLALCYIDTRRYDDARHAFAAQYGLPGDSASAYLLAARMLLRREYLPVAQRFAIRASELDPHLPLAHELLGEIALAQNHLEEATAHLEMERATNPLEPSSYERLGDVYSRAGRYPEARRVLQQAVLLEPNSTGPYILLGKVSLKEDDAVAAVTYLQKAEQMDPANYMTHNLLAQAYRSLGRTADAARELSLTQNLQAGDAPKLTSPK
jgi:predicted Zn-dependent protease